MSSRRYWVALEVTCSDLVVQARVHAPQRPAAHRIAQLARAISHQDWSLGLTLPALFARCDCFLSVQYLPQPTTLPTARPARTAAKVQRRGSRFVVTNPMARFDSSTPSSGSDLPDGTPDDDDAQPGGADAQASALLAALNGACWVELGRSEIVEVRRHCFAAWRYAAGALTVRACACACVRARP